MSDDVQGAGFTPGSEGPARGGEQASSTLPQGGQPNATFPVTTSEQGPQSTPAKRYLWADLDGADRDYKALQAEYTRSRQAWSGLDPADVRQRMAFMEELRSDPQFQAWAESRVAEEQAGSGDPDTVRALQIVQSIADRISEQKVAPFKEQAVAQKIGMGFQTLDREFGQEWREHMPKMGQLIRYGIQRGWYPPSIEQQFDYPFLRSIFLTVANSDPAWGAKQHAKRLATKQAQTSTNFTGAPGSTVGGKAIKSFDDAWTAAKESFR